MNDYLESKLRKIGAAYDAMPMMGGLSAFFAYCGLTGELATQFASIPIPVEFVPYDPYASAAEMFATVKLDGRLLIYTGDSVHPALTPRENHIFRAVHDYYGHIVPSNSFDPAGEFKAWQCHYRMMKTAGAKAAMTTETLGQMAWRVYGPNESLPYLERPYAEQKAGLIDPAMYLDLTEITQ